MSMFFKYLFYLKMLSQNSYPPELKLFSEFENYISSLIKKHSSQNFDLKFNSHKIQVYQQLSEEDATQKSQLTQNMLGIFKNVVLLIILKSGYFNYLNIFFKNRYCSIKSKKCVTIRHIAYIVHISTKIISEFTLCLCHRSAVFEIIPHSKHMMFFITMIATDLSLSAKYNDFYFSTLQLSVPE